MITASHPSSSRRRASRDRGFTLVELIIALAAGLVVSMAAFFLSKGATKFFQHEARISATHLAAMLGMNRITADLKRASYLATRNMATDPAVCPLGGATELATLTGLKITPGTAATAPPQSVVNCMYPDRVELLGSFDATEVFTVNQTLPGAGGGLSVILRNDGPMQRIMASVPAGGVLATRLGEIFKAGRLLRFTDNEQRNEFGIITGLAVVGGAPTPIVTVTIGSAPAVQFKTPANTCGLGGGLNVGLLVSVVSRVRWDIRSLVGDPNYGALVTSGLPAQAAALSYDNTRTELVRVEIDTAGVELGTPELIAEYAVDLKLGVSFSDKGFKPKIAAIGINDYPTPGNALGYTTVAAVPPELVRAVHARLTTRTRAPDRETPLSVGPVAICDPNHRALRFQLDATGEQFARLRTIHTTVNLPNQAGFSQ